VACATASSRFVLLAQSPRLFTLSASARVCMAESTSAVLHRVLHRGNKKNTRRRAAINSGGGGGGMKRERGGEREREREDKEQVRQEQVRHDLVWRPLCFFLYD
jgi:hypothetical protein